MKSILTVIALAAAVGAAAQSVPSTINYQGRLTDNSPQQTPLTATANMSFELWDCAACATPAPDRLWLEPAAGTVPVAVTGGIFIVMLGGNGVPVPASVFAGGAQRYLQVYVNGEALAPRQQIGAAGYAAQAENAATANSAVSAGSAANSASLGGQPAASYLLTSATAYDSSRLGGAPAAGWQKALATPACPANQYLTTLNQDGSGSCAAANVVETDPKVGALTNGRVPRWGGAALVDGSIIDSGLNVGIGTASPVAQLHVAGKTPQSIGVAVTGASPAGVFVRGRLAYVANSTSNTLQIFDISNATPLSVGTVATGVSPNAVFVQGRYAYVVNYGAATLQIFDVSNPAAPAGVGTAATVAQPSALYVQGRYAYLTGFTANMMQIIDVANPAAPVSIATVATGGQPNGIHVQGRYAYVANTATNTLQTLDISNAAAPFSVGTAATGSNPNAVYVQGRYAYVVNTLANTLQIFDVTIPAGAVSVGSVATGAGPAAVTVQGRYAYIVNASANTLQVFDVSNPAAPAGVATAATGANPLSLQVQGRYAYEVNQISGTFQIFDLGGAYLQQLEAGAIETGTLATRGNVQLGGDADVKGGLTTGIGGIATNGRVALGVYVVTCAPNANPYSCACTAGDTLSGGGGTGTAANTLFSSRPFGAGWSVQCATGNCAAAYAICLRHGS